MADDKAQEKKSQVAEREEKVLEFWRENDLFKKTLEKLSPKGEYVFYDGPPFATGTPHYGHILASTIKDAVPRYFTMRGYHVPRRWGWDTHGLPIENIVEKDLKVSGKKQIEDLGIEKFNEYARSKVLDFVHDWKKTVERMARWVDFDGSYKTMDNTFMESVWWALKEMHGKGLVYEGTRVLPYCPRCETPIANSEIAMDNSYRDMTDISVYVKFELVDRPGVFLLAWTTTPWTLPGNFALAVNPEVDYVEVESGGATYVLGKPLFEKLTEKFESPKVVKEYKGSKLAGLRYKPLFPYFVSRDFKNKENAWKVWSADFVTTADGTGIVHVAPGYGEDDMNLAKRENIPFIHHVTTEGKFADLVADFAGMPVKPRDTKENPNLHQTADIEIVKYLAHAGTLFAKEKIVHSYPQCYRCETPLIYYALPAWFVNIQKVKPKLLKLNEKIHWVPEHLKEGRFVKSVEGAPDWNISRSRFWASPLPIWKCDKCAEVEFLGSLDEVRQKTRRNKYLLTRHGEAENNVLRITSGDIKISAAHHLTEKGKGQAEATAKKLKSKKITKIFASPFARTTETAKIIAKTIGVNENEIIFDKRLSEINFGELNGKPIDEYHALFKNDLEFFSKAPAGGETYDDIKKRAGDILYEIDSKFEGENILIVTHDCVDWLLTSVAVGADREQTIKMWGEGSNFIDNCEVRDLDFAAIPHNARYELDLHRPYSDAITWKCDKCDGEMKRIPEVIDCWFESGSMPFAAEHYPFENKKWFNSHFPAQFVAEYIAQTRTWFYYTHAVSTILFGNIPFEHVVTTGTVLAEDGQKMSKSKGNFPDPWILFNKYGADAVRYYLLASPLMKSEDLNFSEKDVDNVYKKIITRAANVLSFYELYKDDSVEADSTSGNVLDRWILSRLAELESEVTTGMEAYELDQAVRPFDLFVDDLSTWYLRRSRDRLKGDDTADRRAALATTRFVLREFSKMLAPFMPFLAEELHQKTKPANGVLSVHLEDWPKPGKPDKNVLEEMTSVRRVVSLSLEARAAAGIKVRQPLASLTANVSVPAEYADIVKDEVNVKEIKFDQKAQALSVDTNITPELKAEGQLRDFVRAVQELRKKAKLDPRDRAALVVETDDAGKQFVTKFEAEIKKSATLKDISFNSAETSGEKLELDGLAFIIRLK